MALRSDIHICLDNIRETPSELRELLLETDPIRQLLTQEVHHNTDRSIRTSHLDRLSGRPHHMQAQRAWIEGAHTTARRT